MKPYGVISDTHNHAWSSFATTQSDGTNSRLQVTLSEIRRCAAEVRAAGGNLIIHAGDMFHVRGSIAPSVLNPTKDCLKELIEQGFEIVILAGNHDLESKESNRLSSAITALEDIGCRIVNATSYDAGCAAELVMVPWHQNTADLKVAIEAVHPNDRPAADLVIHAPIDGVISGLPDHGLTAKYLGELGFRRVFSGHYHHFKDFDNGVYSIGALTHLTWGDVGSKAGFLIVKEEGVTWFKSHAPEFVEITDATEFDEIPLLVDGNYVRAKTSSSKQADIEDLRAHLTKSGAKGITIMAQKAASVEARTGATVSAGASIDVSVNDFIKSKSYANAEKLAILCSNILSETGAEA